MPGGLIRYHLPGKVPSPGSGPQPPRVKTWFLTGKPDPYLGDGNGGLRLTKLRDADS